MKRFLALLLGTVFSATLAGAQTPAQIPAQTAPPVPLPTWFHEIDTAKKGEVARADFIKHRMKTFEQLDTSKDDKLALEEYLKIAEPPFTPDAPNQPPLEERRQRARAEFETRDANRDGFVDRNEAETLLHTEFNQYDTDRNNVVNEAEVRLIVQRMLAQEQAERQQVEARKRQGLMPINEFIDMQLRNADQLDKNGDGKLNKDEWVALAGPAEGPQAQGLPPIELRRQLALRKFAEIDSNKDGFLDRVELTAYAVALFMNMDLNKDRFLNQEEFKKAQEGEAQRLRKIMEQLQPAAPAQQPRPAPAPPRPAPPPPQQPGGLQPGLPQQTR